MKINNRKTRVRTKLKAKSERLRLSVFVSNQHIYAQIIDDQKGVTLVAAKDTDVTKKGKSIDIARAVGLKLAESAQKSKIKDVKFDRGRRKYHGRLKSLADGAREGGLNF